MTDMSVTPEQVPSDNLAAPITMDEQAHYPYGLCISLTEKEMDKLGLMPDCEVGHVIEFHAMARVMAISASASEHSSTCRIELQIENMDLDDEYMEGE